MSIFSFNCPSCGRLHTIDGSMAETCSIDLIDKLERYGRIDFEAIEPDPRLSTAPLFGEARGQMFGILLCSAAPSTQEQVVLKAFSGQFNGVWEVPGWAPPLLDSSAFEKAAGRADPQIKHLGVLIDNLPPGCSERLKLTEDRRKLSRQHMIEIHSLYSIRNFKGDSTDLFTLFSGKRGIPSGTGDCCAPKLLGWAAALGLKPLSLAEFFFGRENRSGTKQHCVFYPPCEDKCRPILGYMLCGSDSDAYTQTEVTNA